MARLRTSYVRDEEGRMRRGDPDRDADIGPAAAAVDGLAAMGRLWATAAQEYLEADVAVAMGSGAIERRRATPADLARLTPVELTPVREGTAMHLHRPAARSAPRSVPPAEPTTTPVNPNSPWRAWRRLEAEPSRHEEEPVTVTAPPPTQLDLPCVPCLHAPVCGLRASIPASAGAPMAITAGFPAGLRMVVSAFRVECDHQLVSLRPVPVEPIRAEHGGESWRTPVEPAKRHASKKGEEAAKAERAAAAIAAVARHSGDRRAAAAELGMKVNALAMVLKFASLRTGDPDAVPA